MAMTMTMTITMRYWKGNEVAKVTAEKCATKGSARSKADY
jgi:hypothetical protein